MYSRSYGSMESERKTDGISIPADYNGSLYPSRTERKEPPKKQEYLPLKDSPVEVPEEKAQPASHTEPSAPPRPSGNLSSLLEKFSAEDIILFVLVFSLMKEDNGDPGIILAVMLALLLL